MVQLQGVVFIAVLCAVSAAVTVNIYEDENVRVKVHEVESCNDASCDRTCRLLGFTSGICVGDTCECMKQKKDEQIQQNDISSLDEDITGNGLGGCDPNACYQLCRRLKFRSGTCINGRCKCDNFRRESVIELLEQNDIPSLDEGVSDIGLSGCDPNACYQLCRRLKFPSGTCVNGRCKCDNFRRELELLEKNDIPSLDEDIRGNGLSGCDPNACYQLCRRLKFPSGTCVNGRCKCDNFRREPDFEIFRDQGVKEIRGNGLSGCDPNACYQMCRRLKFPSGTCVNGRCKCDNFRREPDFEIFRDQGVKEIISNSIDSNYVDTRKVVTMPIQDCDQLACMMGCQELGFPGGSCFLDKCRCNKRGKEEEIIRSLKNCNSVTCNLMCLRLKYHGGWCRFDRCECF